jgi:hypothetical protein
LGDFTGECETGNQRERVLRLGAGLMDNDTEDQHLAGEITLGTSSGDGKSKKGAKWFIVATAGSCIFGCILFNLNAHLHFWQPILSFAFIFFSLVLAPLLGIVACIISLKIKTTSDLGCVFSILLVPVLSVLLLVAGRLFIINLLPYIYTPPALTSKNLAIYNECIKFAEDHSEYKDLKMLRRGWVWINGVLHGADYPYLKGVLSDQEIHRLINLIRKLKGVKCEKFERHNDMFVFYKAATSNLLAYPEDILWLLPPGPGVVYSLNGDDPNEIESQFLNVAKPYIRITDNWYISRHLMLAGSRSDMPASVPKSLFDHSLGIDGIDPNELQKFD